MATPLASLRLAGSAPIAPATAHLMAHPELSSHLGWSSPREPHLSLDTLARDLASAGLSVVRCPDCGADMRVEAIRSLVPGGGLVGVGYSLDVEFHCPFCQRFAAVSSLFAGLVLACGFAASEALTARTGQPAPSRSCWPGEAEVSLSQEYASRGEGWGGNGTRRTWLLPGPVAVEVTMADWYSEGGRSYGEDLYGTITLPDGSRASINAASLPLQLTHHDADWQPREDEITRAIRAVFNGQRGVPAAEK